MKHKNKVSDYAAQCLAGGIVVVATGTSVSEAVGGRPLGHVTLTIVVLLIACMVQWSRPRIVARAVLSSQFGLSVLAQP